MAKYHIQWRVDLSRMPDTPQAVAAGLGALVGRVQKDLEEGKLTEWGGYPGERGGYAVLEGTEEDVSRLTLQYAPHVIFEVHPVMDVDAYASFLRKMSS